VFALSQVVEREAPTRVVDQPLEVDARLPQASLQRALIWVRIDASWGAIPRGCRGAPKC
jgi:hypothetical protein